MFVKLPQYRKPRFVSTARITIFFFQIYGYIKSIAAGRTLSACEPRCERSSSQCVPNAITPSAQEQDVRVRADAHDEHQPGIWVPENGLDPLQPGRVQGLGIAQVGSTAQATRDSKELAEVGIDRRHAAVHDYGAVSVLRRLPRRGCPDQKVLVTVGFVYLFQTIGRLPHS